MLTLRHPLFFYGFLPAPGRDTADDNSFLKFHFFSDVKMFVHPKTEQLFKEVQTTLKDGSSDLTESTDHIVDPSNCECEV